MTTALNSPSTANPKELDLRSNLESCLVLPEVSPDRREMLATLNDLFDLFSESKQ